MGERTRGLTQIALSRAKSARNLLTYIGFLSYTTWFFYFINTNQLLENRLVLIDTIAIPLTVGIFIFIMVFSFKIVSERLFKLELPPLDDIRANEKPTNNLIMWIAIGFLLAPTIGAMHALVWINLAFILVVGV